MTPRPLSGSGGAGIVASDLVEKAGLELADLSPATRETLAGLYPEWMPVANPVDLFPAMERSGSRAYTEAFKAVCADPNVDAVVVPGGFAHGDYLRSGAIARFSPIMEAVSAFADEGGAVLGIHYRREHVRYQSPPKAAAGRRIHRALLAKNSDR